MPIKISVSGSLSHMTKVWENLKLPMQRCKVALPSEDIANPSHVFKCAAAGSILVLYQSSSILYTLVWTRERTAPEFIRALNLLSACTVTVAKSSASAMV